MTNDEDAAGGRYEKAEHLVADAVSADVVRPMLLGVAHTPIFKELERYELEQLSAYASVSKISAVRTPSTIRPLQNLQRAAHVAHACPAGARDGASHFIADVKRASAERCGARWA